MTPLGLALKLTFYRMATWAQGVKPLTAHESYAGSDMKKVVDAIAELGDVQREGDASFTATLSRPNEKTVVSFTHDTVEGKPHFRLQTASECKTEEKNGIMTFTSTESGSFNYNLTGENVAMLVTPAPRFIPFIGGKAFLAPNDAVKTLFESLAGAAPQLCGELAEKTGMAAPAAHSRRPKMWVDALDMAM